MIVITGATGHLGSLIVAELLQRVSPDQVAVTTRDVDRAKDLAARGVRVRHGDFADPAGLESAFEGATQVLVVSVTSSPQGLAYNKAAIDAAYRAGARRVLYTSREAARPDSYFAPARHHAAIDAYLAECGRPFTSLHNGYYTESLMSRLGGAVETGELVAPADGPVSWTTRADLAAGTAAILTDEGSFEGATPPLTASDMVDLEQVAGLLSEVCGRPVKRVVISDQEWMAKLVEEGMTEQFAHLALGTHEAARNGEFAVTDPTLRDLIGREPTPVKTVLETAFGG